MWNSWCLSDAIFAYIQSEKTWVCCWVKGHVLERSCTFWWFIPDIPFQSTNELFSVGVIESKPGQKKTPKLVWLQLPLVLEMVGARAPITLNLQLSLAHFPETNRQFGPETWWLVQMSLSFWGKRPSVANSLVSGRGKHQFGHHGATVPSSQRWLDVSHTPQPGVVLLHIAMTDLVVEINGILVLACPWKLVTIVGKLVYFTYILHRGRIQPTYIGVIIHLLSTMDIQVWYTGMVDLY